jgi:uncharacterized membrane protein
VFFSENKRSDENVLIGVIIVLGIIIIVIISIIAYKWFTRKRDEDNSHAQSGSTAEQKEMTSFCNGAPLVRQRSRNN